MMKSSSDWITIMQPSNAFTWLMVEHHISFKTCVLSATSAGLRKQFFSDVLLSATQVQQFVCQLPAFPPHIQSCGFQRTAEVSHKNLKTPVEGWMIHGPAGLAQDHARPTTSRIRRNRQVGQRTIATHQDQQGGRLFLVTGTSLNLTKLSILPKANDWRAATEESHEHDCDATQGRCEQPFLQETMQSRWIDVNRWIRQFNAEDSVSKGDAQEVWDERMASNPTQDMISRTCSDWNRMPKMVSMWSVSDWHSHLVESFVCCWGSQTGSMYLSGRYSVLRNKRNWRQHRGRTGFSTVKVWWWYVNGKSPIMLDDLPRYKPPYMFRSYLDTYVYIFINAHIGFPSISYCVRWFSHFMAFPACHVDSVAASVAASARPDRAAWCDAMVSARALRHQQLSGLGRCKLLPHA